MKKSKSFWASIALLIVICLVAKSCLCDSNGSSSSSYGEESYQETSYDESSDYEEESPVFSNSEVNEDSVDEEMNGVIDNSEY